MDARSSRRTRSIAPSTLRYCQDHPGGAQADKLFAALRDQTLAVFDAADPLSWSTIESVHSGPINALVVADPHFYSGSDDCTVHVGDVASGDTVLHLHARDAVVALAVAGDRLLSATSMTTMQAWDMTMHQHLGDFGEHMDDVKVLAAHDGKLFASAAEKIRVWDVVTFEALATLERHEHVVTALVARNAHLFSGSYGAIHIWDLASPDGLAPLVASLGATTRVL